LFVLVGSAASAWGAVGTSVTAPADARLAAIAAARRADGFGGQLVALMPRTDTGELDERNRALMEDSGLRPLPPEAVTDAVDYLVRASVAQAQVADVDRAAYVDVCRRSAPRSFLDQLAAGSGEGGGGGGGAPGRPAPLLAELAAHQPAAREDLLVERLLAEVASVLGLDSGDDIGPDQGFFDLGMDSVMSLRLKTRVERSTGCDLPATLTFEFPTTRALARHLLDEAGLSAPDEPAALDAPPAPDESPTPDALDELDDLTEEELLSRLDAALDESAGLLSEDI